MIKMAKFLVFFEKQNVSATVAHNKTDILYAILHDKLIMRVSSWATAVDTLFYL